MRRAKAVDVLLGFLLALVALPARAQDESNLRDLIVAQTDEKGQTQGPLRQAGLETVYGFQWKFLVRSPDGEFVPASTKEKYPIGTAFRIEVEAFNDLYVYIHNRGPGPSNNESLLLPQKGQEAILLRKGEKTTLPGVGKAIFFQAPPGAETFTIVAAPVVVPKMNLALADAGQAAVERDLVVSSIKEENRKKTIRTKTPVTALNSAKDSSNKESVLLPHPDDESQEGTFVVRTSARKDQKTPLTHQVILYSKPRGD